MWQLLLILVLAGLIGGTGLAGLSMARSALSTVSHTRMPALVDVLEAERDIAQMDFYGQSAVLDTDPEQLTQVDFPKIRSFCQAGWQSSASRAASPWLVAGGPDEERRVARGRVDVRHGSGVPPGAKCSCWFVRAASGEKPRYL